MKKCYKIVYKNSHGKLVSTSVDGFLEEEYSSNKLVPMCMVFKELSYAIKHFKGLGPSWYSLYEAEAAHLEPVYIACSHAHPISIKKFWQGDDKFLWEIDPCVLGYYWAFDLYLTRKIK